MYPFVWGSIGLMVMDGLTRVEELCAAEHGLATVVTLRADGSPHASVVNAGVLDHPLSGTRVVGFAVIGRAKKLDHIRRDPRITIVFRSAWEWVAVDGRAEIVGPDDPVPGVDPPARALLLRTIYAAAVGGTPEEWIGVDEAAERERHSAVLVTPERFYSSPAGGAGRSP